jgi:hypothetical protein
MKHVDHLKEKETFYPNAQLAMVPNPDWDR